MRTSFIQTLVVAVLCSHCVAAKAPNVSLPQTPGTSAVTLQLNQGPYGKRYAFPEIHDWKTLRIGLYRSACLGTCPDYKVEIDGDGSVRYNGRACVAINGTRISRISLVQVRLLYEAFRRADFFSLRALYNENTFDAPGVELWLGFDRWGKTVADNVLTEGLPSDAAKLPDMIDRAAQTARWIGDPGRNCMRDH